MKFVYLILLAAIIPTVLSQKFARRIETRGVSIQQAWANFKKEYYPDGPPTNEAQHYNYFKESLKTYNHLNSRGEVINEHLYQDYYDESPRYQHFYLNF